MLTVLADRHVYWQDAFYDDGQAMANAEAAERKRAGPDKSQANLTAMFDHYAGM